MTLEEAVAGVLKTHYNVTYGGIFHSAKLARDLAERIDKVHRDGYDAGFRDMSRRHGYRKSSELQRATVAAFIGGEK